MYYKPLLGNKLEFPADWVGVRILITDESSGFDRFIDAVTFQMAIDIAGPADVGVYFFRTFAGMLTALENEPENRQLHVMVDLISWHCKGTGTERLPPQLGLDFGSDELQDFY